MPFATEETRHFQDWLVLMAGAWLPAHYRIWAIRLGPDDDSAALRNLVTNQDVPVVGLYAGDHIWEPSDRGFRTTIDLQDWLTPPVEFCLVVTRTDAPSLRSVLEPLGSVRILEVDEPAPGQALLVLGTFVRLLGALPQYRTQPLTVPSIFGPGAKERLVDLVGRLARAKGSKTSPYVAVRQFVADEISRDVERRIGIELISQVLDTAELAAKRSYGQASPNE